MLSCWPVRNLLSPNQAMNASFDPLHLVNTYGAFGSVSRERYEVIVEGTLDGDPSTGRAWQEYEFKGKPGDVRRRPPQVAPYHLRLDWLMWFMPLSPGLRRGLARSRSCAACSRATPRCCASCGVDPFPDAPPTCVRARLFHYRFTTAAERRETGAWWARSPSASSSRHSAGRA